LIKKAIEIYFRRSRSRDDLIQWGQIGLFKAVKSYQPDKGSWSVYAIICIRNAVQNGLRAQRRGSYKPGAFASVPYSENLLLTEMTYDPISPIDDAAELTAALNTLTQQEREVLVRSYFKAPRGQSSSTVPGQGSLEIAREMGLSHARIIQIRKKALSKLGKVLDASAKEGTDA
jgi:RNA polymerase sigma factor (sigma-70 family)